MMFFLTNNFPKMVATILCSIAFSPAYSQTLEDSFGAGLGQLNGVAFNDATETIFAHASNSSTITTFDLSGNNTGSIPDPGDNGNDSDYFFTSVATNIAGIAIPANTLLIIEDDIGVAQLIAADPTSGAVLAIQDLPFVTGQLVGGAFNPATGTFFAVDWSADQIYEFAGSNGSLLNTFPVGAGFDVFFGDIAVNENDGNIYVVSSSQDVVRILTPAGSLVSDVDVSSIGVTGMSGIDIRESTGEAIICSTNGTIYRVSGFYASVFPDSFEVVRGTYVAGDESSIASSDNVDLQIRRSSSDIQARVEVQVNGVSPTESPTAMTFRHESSVFARSDVTQILLMYDYGLGVWETLDTRLANRFSDLTTETTVEGDLSRFVEAGSGNVSARIRYLSANARQQFQANIDQLIWTVQ